MQVTKVAITSNVATVNVTVREGNIPVAGGAGSGFGGVTIQGTSQAGGAFNVTNATLTNVTIGKTTGIGTITFALTHADVAAIADAGQAYVSPDSIGEALATGSSQAFAIQEIGADDDNQL